MAVENKDFARILKEIGLFGLWKKERIKYYTKNKFTSGLYPSDKYFPSCLSHSFLWIDTECDALWATLGGQAYSVIGSTLCKDIVNSEKTIKHLRKYVKDYYNKLKTKG